LITRGIQGTKNVARCFLCVSHLSPLLFTFSAPCFVNADPFAISREKLTSRYCIQTKQVKFLKFILSPYQDFNAINECSSCAI